MLWSKTPQFCLIVRCEPPSQPTKSTITPSQIGLPGPPSFVPTPQTAQTNQESLKML